ncbi:ComEC/Rec2 family competence protein [Nonomuraea sp. NPDC050383]|uniref:ComEC/Rec2 family competence protein n=1 Tax=Nonomuraea sp. NPDC050383 TaxID=3364362 RepID=UPI0037A106E8
MIGGHTWILTCPALAVWAVTLALLSSPPTAGLTVSALSVLGAFGTAVLAHRHHRWRPWRNVIIAALACTAAASASVATRVHAVTTAPVADLARHGATITAEITLADDPKIKLGRFHQEQVVVHATLDTYRTPHLREAVSLPVLVLAHGPEWRPLLPSQRVQVVARLAEPTPGELTAAVLLVRGSPKVLTSPSRLQAIAGTLRAGLRTATDVLPPDQRGLLPGLVVGDVSRMDPQVSADLKESGLNHLNAVSGTNLSIVAGAALALSRVAGLPLALRAGLAAVAMIGFAVVARPSPSVLRALLMGLVAAIALGTGRPKDGMAALSAAVLLLILFSPDLAISYGFALSVCATAGILLLAPRWRDRLTHHPRTTADTRPAATSQADTRPAATSQADTRPAATSQADTRPAATSQADTRPAATSQADTRPAVTTPYTGTSQSDTRPPPAHTRDSAPGPSGGSCSGLSGGSSSGLSGGSCSGLSGGPPSGPSGGPPSGPSGDPPSGPSGEASSTRRGRLPRWVAEAVAVPAAAQVAVTPILVLMAGQVSLAAIPANLLAGPAVAPATLLGFAAALVAPFWPEAARIIVIPAGYAVGWIIMVARWAVNLPLATLPWPGGIAGLALLALAAVAVTLLVRRRSWRAVALAVAAGVLVAVLVVRPVVAPWPPRAWLMVVCDVGQGDGLVLAAGPGRGVVVDTGPDSVTMDRCLRRLDITDVPLVILTHPHADHIDGLSGVLRGRRVGAVVVSPQRSLDNQASRLTADLARQRIPQWTAPPGTHWRLGPSELTVLAPEPTRAPPSGQGEGSAANNSSVVVHVRWRAGSALLSGDIETEAQDALLRGGLLPPADILKVPHHGSPRQDPAFFGAVGARAALISVGEGNDYGHPAQPTLSLLRRLGARVYRTDRSGDLAVVEREGRLAIVTRGSQGGDRPP